jgi:Zn-dependent peptidase ImmA (M78 family)
MTLRRGFKAEAHAYAREFRTELGLAPHDPLCPWVLAQHLEIPVIPLTDLTEIPEAVGCLTGRERQSFSAVTVFCRSRRCIIYNDAHHRHRQASSISHEISHGILGHPPTPPLNEYGCRHYDKAIEDEANWLGPALLISEEATLHIIRTGMLIPDAIKTYGVSDDVIIMRLNVTAARRRIERRARITVD